MRKNFLLMERKCEKLKMTHCPQGLTFTPLGPTQTGRVLAWGQGDLGLRVWAPHVGCPQCPPAAPAHGVTLQILDCRETQGAVRTPRPGREPRPEEPGGPARTTFPTRTHPGLHGSSGPSGGRQGCQELHASLPGRAQAQGSQPRGAERAQLQPPVHTHSPPRGWDSTWETADLLTNSL